MEMHRSTIVLPVAMATLVIGLLIGWMRYLEIYGYTLLPLPKLYYIHPHIMIFGFISLVILFERYRGVGVSKSYKNILLLGILSNILAILFLLIGNQVNMVNIVKLGYYLLIIPPSTYIIFLLLNRSLIYRPVFTLHLTSKLLYILGLSVDVVGYSLDRYSYSLLLLSYPTLFILGERLELTRFIAPKKWIEKLIYLNSFLYLLTSLFILVYGGYSYYIGYLLGLSLMALVLTIISLDPTLKIRRNVDIRMGYLSFHLKIGYVLLMLGILIYYIGKIGIPGVNLYDTYVHFFALGFIGMMLVGHGPIILSSLLNIKVRLRYIPTYLLLSGIVVRVAQNLLYTYLPLILSMLFSLLSGILIFLALITFIFNTVLYGAILSRKGRM